MKAVGLPVLATLILAAKVWGAVPQVPGDDYWQRRASLLREEESLMIGGDLQLNSEEQLANRILMNAKSRELDDGFRNQSTFPPTINFMEARSRIEASSVYQIIAKMPKGAILHAHDMAITSFNFTFWNITFRPNLYICNVNGTLNFRFFDQPSSDCQWQLLSEVRRNDREGVVDRRVTRQLTKLPDEVFPDVDASWRRFGVIFTSMLELLSYRPVYEDYYYQGLLEFYNDNVLYLELRTSLPTLYDLDGTQYGPVEVARIYKRVTDRFIQDHPDFVGVKLIYAPLRDVNQTQMDEYLETVRQLNEALPNFFIGFDIAGQEDKGKPLVEFADKLSSIGDGVQFFFHAGETLWNGLATDDNLIDAVLLNTKRIGHGYALLKHPKIMEIVREKQIAIEVSPLSNQLSFGRDLRNHPASALFANNYPVVVSNDDPGLWGAQGLSYDFYEAFMGMMSSRADLRALKKLAMNSISYSAMNESEKNQATEIWQRKWSHFVTEVAGEL